MPLCRCCAGRQGVLEIKCPASRSVTSDSQWQYLVQIQALMEITDMDWAHLFVYKPAEGALLVSGWGERDMGCSVWGVWGRFHVFSYTIF